MLVRRVLWLAWLAGCAGAPAAPAALPAALEPATSEAADATAVQPVAAGKLAVNDPPVCEPLEIALPEISTAAEDPPVPPIVDAARLAPFFERTARLLRGRAEHHVRIAVYGDSNLTMDYMTGHMRRWLQAQHGDAGHGFVALARPWSHYQHMDVRHGTDGGWKAYAVTTDPVLDRRYGLSGIAAESLWKNAVSWVATDPDAPIGRHVGRADVFFLEGPRYGTFHVDVDGARHATVDARAEETKLGVHRIELEDGPHELRFVSADAKYRTRLLGVALERDTPGFVVDSFGVGALNTLSHAREDPDINRAMLRARDYDLIVFATGANDPFTIGEVPEAMARLVALHREALPDAPILMLTPADRGKERTLPGTLKVVQQRIELAREHETAFWNLFEAMGGENSMKSFHRRGLAKNDYIHFTERGGAYAAHRLLYALWRGLAAHLAENPRAGCG